MNGDVWEKDPSQAVSLGIEKFAGDSLLRKSSSQVAVMVQSEGTDTSSEAFMFLHKLSRFSKATPLGQFLVDIRHSGSGWATWMPEPPVPANDVNCRDSDRSR